MNVKLYTTPAAIVAGVTLADSSEPEAGNMAIHVCENTENIIESRMKLAALLNCGIDNFVSAYQTHSANFYKVTRADKGRGSMSMDDSVRNTDALYTFEPELLLCCFTADCVPLIFYDEISGLVGAVHSGWQGTVQEITPKVLDHLIEEEHCDPQNIRIFLGPSISRDRFEVDRDVFERFEALGYADEFIRFNEGTGKYHIDNGMTVKRQCERKGVPAQNILVDRTCTYNHPDCFSYRRDKHCGRHLSFIMRRR